MIHVTEIFSSVGKLMLDFDFSSGGSDTRLKTWVAVRGPEQASD